MDVSSIRIWDKEYAAREVRWEGGDIVVKVEGRPKRGPFPCYGRIYVFRYCKGKIRKLLNSWSNGKSIYLELQRKPWRCRKCGRCYSDGEGLLLPYSSVARAQTP